MLKKERPNILIDAKKVLDSVQLESKQQDKEGIHEKAGDAEKRTKNFIFKCRRLQCSDRCTGE